MSGREIYMELLNAPDLETAAEALSAKDLAAALGYLDTSPDCSWPAQRMHGVCILEAARRFLARLEVLP